MIGVFAKILDPLFGVIDKVVVDKDEREKIRAEILLAAMTNDTELNKAASSIIVAEAQGEGRLQRSWRPVTMLSFLGLIWSYWLGLAPDYIIANPAIVDRVFMILQIGIGGYIMGRSGEKMVKEWAKK